MLMMKIDIRALVKSLPYLILTGSWSLAGRSELSLWMVPLRLNYHLSWTIIKSIYIKHHASEYIATIHYAEASQWFIHSHQHSSIMGQLFTTGFLEVGVKDLDRHGVDWTFSPGTVRSQRILSAAMRALVEMEGPDSGAGGSWQDQTKRWRFIFSHKLSV